MLCCANYAARTAATARAAATYPETWLVEAALMRPPPPPPQDPPDPPDPDPPDPPEPDPPDPPEPPEPPEPLPVLGDGEGREGGA